MLRLHSFLFALSLLAMPVWVGAQTSPVVSADRSSAATCEAVIPCGKVQVIVEELSTLSVDKDVLQTFDSSVTVYVGKLACGGGETYMRFDTRTGPPKSRRQRYGALPFAVGAHITLRGGHSKDVATQTPHVLNLLHVEWDEGTPKYGDFSYPLGGGRTWGCKVYLTEDQPTTLSLTLDGDVVAKDLVCVSPYVVDVDCTTYDPPPPYPY